jgi:hypothetical protein
MLRIDLIMQPTQRWALFVGMLLSGLTTNIYADIQWQDGYEVYLPNVTNQTVYTGRSHDSSIIFFDGKWVAMWDSGTEKDGQVIWQSTSTDLIQWSAPIQAFSSSEGSQNPISSTSTRRQWQPSLLVAGSELWCLWSATDKGVYFSKIGSAGEKWFNRLLYGKNSISIEGINWTPFVSNGGIRAASGKIIFPITLVRDSEEWFSAPKRDSVIFTDDGGNTWGMSTGISYGPTGAQCWEATIWEPEPNKLNMISRNVLDKVSLNPLESLKFTTAQLGDINSWKAEALLPLELANSRPHVMKKGSRSFLVQNDSHIVSTDLGANRKNISLLFNRGNGSDFVAGLTLFPETNFANQTWPHVDYPQMEIQGDRGVVIFSHRVSTPTDWTLKVAIIDPLPSETQHYIFPRTARGAIESVTVEGRQCLRFKDNYSSAGVDINANSPLEDKIAIGFDFKAESSDSQTVLSFGAPSVNVFVDHGRAKMTVSGSSTNVDCGPVSGWTSALLVSGMGKTTLEILNSHTSCGIEYAPVDGRALYFGLKYYGDAVKTVGASFLIDVNSIKTAIVDVSNPTVTITTPTAGTIYTTPQTVPVKVTATDTVGVAKVWFLRNNVVVSTDTASPYEYSWPITGANNGAHTWKAMAFDAMGNSSSTVAVPVTVNIDITPPAVALTTPTAGTTYTTPQSVPVKATATDAVGVAKVWFIRNDVVVSTDTASPYEYSWPITGANNGAHSWKATAFDAMGNSSTTVAVPVTVNIDITPPAVALTTPTAGTTYTTPQSVPVKATATDAVEVAKVWFLRNNVVVSTDTASPYEFSWAITGANNGAHTWKAMAFDAMGNSSSTVAVPVTVNIDITPPAVALTTPTAGTTYTTPQSVPVKATATDEVEVAKVWFLRNNVVVSTDTASPYEYSWPITGANNGAHSWKATAFDAMGNSSTTVPVPVTVNIDITPPAVALTTPTAGTTYTTPQSVLVKATATDAVEVAKVWFLRNNVVVSTDTASPYEFSWPITGANNGAHSWKATAFDAMGNSSTTVPVPVTVNIDITPPAVALTTPTAGTTYTTPQSVPVKATATDAVEVAKVWFLRNNVVVSTDTASPYEYSWAITGANNGAHSWKATAFDAMGNSSTTVAVPVTVNIDITPPAVALTTPTAGTTYTTPQSVPVKATATDAVGVTKVWFVLNDVVVSTDTTLPYQYSWPITGANNGAYAWKSTAFDAMGNSSTTVAVPVTVNIDILPPSTPVLQSPTELSTTSVKLSWSAATDNVGVTGYRLYRDTFLITTIGGEETSFLDSGLAPETLYKYTVAAFDDMGNTSAMSPELSVTTPRRALLAPRGSVSGVSPQSVGIRWASVEGASRYTLAASLSVTSGHEFSLQREIPASETSDNESISGLSPNTTYYLYLNACNEFDCTDFVLLGSAVTHALAPALTAAEGKGKEVRLTINANGNPAGTKYRIEMSRGGEEFALATTATSLSPVMGDLTPGERYIFRVKAENHAGVATEPSNTLSATIAPETMDRARAFPVPFRPGIGAEGITFDQIPEGSSVKIYTIDGRPVKTLSTDTAGKALWTLDNEEGNSVASGVYIAVIEKAGARKKIKVVVQN